MGGHTGRQRRWLAPAAGRFAVVSCSKSGHEKGATFQLLTTLRTNTQERTQHAQGTPQNDSCGQLQTMCDCPAVLSASSVRAGGQRRPFRRAFKSQMSSSRLPRHLKFTLTLRSNQASSPMTLRLRRGGKEVEKGVGRPQVAGGKSSGRVMKTGHGSGNPSARWKERSSCRGERQQSSARFDLAHVRKTVETWAEGWVGSAQKH